MYKEDLDPIKAKNNIIFLLVYLFCFVTNFIIIYSRQDSKITYALTKQIKLITMNNMKMGDDFIKGEVMSPKSSLPQDREALWQYFYEYIPLILLYD